MAQFDPHSFADDTQPRIAHVGLDLSVDFEARVISGTATLRLDRPASGQLDLDCRNLQIEDVVDSEGQHVPYDLSVTDAIKGTRLRLGLHGSSTTIRYRTSPEAMALQWLSPAQTAGKRHPYVFTQCQPIHARTLFPCQDTPTVRMRYTARLVIPKALRAVMAAAHKSRVEEANLAVESFEMNQPIPSYLFALAIGDIESREVGPRSRVWAEREVLDAAAHEFAEVNSLLVGAESLFGPYDWERFDLLVMPPSFPYGGMENPRLTFLTPTLIAGDRSLVNVVAHELAHSWTGNLITNATMDHFWLNEGFTTYAERRIGEANEGADMAALHAALGLAGLEEDLERFSAQPEWQRLRMNLTGIDPDAVYSRIPYEKGYVFLRRIEDAVGRAEFDRYLSSYIATFRFRSITTDDFLGHLRSFFPSIDEHIDLLDWIDGSGLPADAPRPSSERLERLAHAAREFATQGVVNSEEAARWNSTDWQIFISRLPSTLPHPALAALYDPWVSARAGNAEIRTAFLTIAAASGWEPALDRIDKDLREIGRMKYLRPLYSALVSGGDQTRALADKVFNEAKHGYHPVARAVIDGLLARSPTG